MPHVPVQIPHTVRKTGLSDDSSDRIIASILAAALSK
jgi:hypothetical protein